MRGAAARRYAKALFELAREEGGVDAVRRELGELTRLLDAQGELRDVLLRPMFPVAQRRSVLTAVADRLGAGPELRSFYAYLIDQRRLVDLGAIREEFERLADADAGISRARVVSAAPLRDDQLARIRAALAAHTGGQVELTVEVDESLLGGVVAQVGDTVFDGSLRTQLTQLRESLSQG